MADRIESLTAEDRAFLVESLVAATRTVLGEMAGVENLTVRPRNDQESSAVRIVVDLQSVTLSQVVFNFPEMTAAALAGRILADVPAGARSGLTEDCLCEFANVVAGQVKAKLTDTKMAFAFSLPVVSKNAAEMAGISIANETIISFESEIGPLTVQVPARA